MRGQRVSGAHAEDVERESFLDQRLDLRRAQARPRGMHDEANEAPVPATDETDPGVLALEPNSADGLGELDLDDAVSHAFPLTPAVPSKARAEQSATSGSKNSNRTSGKARRKLRSTR